VSDDSLTYRDKAGSIRFDGKKFRTAMRKSEGILNTEFANGLKRMGRDFHRRFSRTNLRMGRPPGGKRYLKVRTGSLLRSFHSVVVKGSNVSRTHWHYGTPIKYAPVQELGTRGRGGKLPDIRPKKGQYLTIPLRASRGHGGKNQGHLAKPWRDYKHTFVRPSKRRPGTLIGWAGDTYDDMKPRYILAKKVAIPPRMKLFAGWRHFRMTEAPAHWAQILDTALKRIAAPKKKPGRKTGFLGPKGAGGWSTG